MSESPSGTGILIMFVGMVITLYGFLVMMASGVTDLIQAGILSENILIELLYSATLGTQSFLLAIVLIGVGFGVKKVGEDML